MKTIYYARPLTSRVPCDECGWQENRRVDHVDVECRRNIETKGDCWYPKGCLVVTEEVKL